MSSLPLLLERLGSLIQQSMRDDAARHGLQPVHIQVLHYLAHANRYSDMPIAVAEYLGVTRGTISQSVAVLERKRLLVKETDAAHRRRVHLKLTPAGRTVLNGSWAERLDQVVQSLSVRPTDVERSLRDVLVALQRLNDQRAFGICRQCAHYRRKASGNQCGLTGEPLSDEQSAKLCREWTAPGAESAARSILRPVSR